ncbi:MAG: cation transporter [Bacteroidales bacterium]|jgi:copper chaperone CopZ
MRFIIPLLIFAAFAACTQQTDKSKANQDSGDTSNYVSVTLCVKGMTCEGCEKTIAKSVASLEGIKEVSASHVDSMARVTYDSTLTSIPAISKKINSLGYKVEGTTDRSVE